jgi:hypothetical protein
LVNIIELTNQHFKTDSQQARSSNENDSYSY